MTTSMYPGAPPMIASKHRIPGLGRGRRPVLLAAALCALPALAAAAPQDGLEVEVEGARRVPCPDQEVVESRDMAAADLCFTAPATATLELRLESATPETLRSVVMTRYSAVGTGTSRSILAKNDSTTWTGELPLARVPRRLAPTPDAPLVKPTGTLASLFANAGATGPFATGHHLIDLEAGAALHRVVIGITITSSGKTDPLMQWTVADGRARLVLGGCWKHSLDPILELALTDCEEPQYAVKVATVDPQGKLSLEQYVKNSRRAYKKIWARVSQHGEPGPPEVIVLELEQMIAADHRTIQKHFIAVEDRFLIVTFYGPGGKKKRLRKRVGPRSDWLLIGGDSPR